MWDHVGMWQGRDPDTELTFDGSAWGAIGACSEGVVTRRVLLDVPRHRGEEYVTLSEPVHGVELESVAEAQGDELQAGDALVVYSGRDRWDREHRFWASDEAQPGLHASCLKFIRDHDVAILAWDMQDLSPGGYGLPWSVHAAIFAFGIGIVDNCELSQLASVSRDLGRWEFMFTPAPLPVRGGTGSPVNPIALF